MLSSNRHAGCGKVVNLLRKFWGWGGAAAISGNLPAILDAVGASTTYLYVLPLHEPQTRGTQAGSHRTDGPGERRTDFLASLLGTCPPAVGASTSTSKVFLPFLCWRLCSGWSSALVAVKRNLFESLAFCSVVGRSTRASLLCCEGSW